jgi:hypothetical protein
MYPYFRVQITTNMVTIWGQTGYLEWRSLCGSVLKSDERACVPSQGNKKVFAEIFKSTAQTLEGAPTSESAPAYYTL